MPASTSAVKGMVPVPGGSFVMGSVDFYPEERPLRQVEVADLWIDEHPVTNAQFRRFVRDTGHVTVAEQVPDPADFPGADQADLVPGSQLFVGTPGPVPLDDWTPLVSLDSRRRLAAPEGPGNNLHGRDRPARLRTAKTQAESFGYDSDRLYCLSAADWASAELARASTGGTFDMGAALLEGRRGAAVQGVVDGQWVPGSTRCVFRIGCGLRLVGPTFGRFHGQQ